MGKCKFSVCWLGYLLLLCLGDSGAAQTTNWQSFLVQWHGKPASILVDMDLAHRNDLAKYPYLVSTGPALPDCGPKGIPTADNIATMEEVLDLSDNFITGLTAKLHAGTTTYNCQRLNYYYVQDTTGIRNAIGRMYRRNYSGYSYVVKIKPDVAWAFYHDFLYPTDTLLNEAENNNIITGLLKAGDSLRGHRLVRFAASFKTDSARTHYIADAVQLGYKLNTARTAKELTYKFQVLVSATMALTTETMNTASWAIRQLIKKHGGIYQQWHCSPGE
ncbi:MAG: DUF695 domain-containing protein [Chitinophagia bacterium]|nr:DUF695 domain-containing protein [Chitinophagia bacterium]